jgi:purine-binding chemotaxis protein CheW
VPVYFKSGNDYQEDIMSSEHENQQLEIGVQGKFLTFVLDGQEYGIEILRVLELVGMMNITPVAKAPKYVKGVMNLRGKIIPVLDLRLKFGLQEAIHTEKTCIIVTDIKQGELASIQVGLIVDTVSEVIEVTPENVEKTPSFGGGFEPDHILAMAKLKGSVKTLLDINSVISREELATLAPKVEKALD